MKTLDETIFEAPYTMTPWEENAIYYLKEYRDHMKNEIIELQEEVKKQKEMIEFLEKSLTWDELKQMEGKPVWVKVDEKWWGRFWAFVEIGNDSYMNFYPKGQEYPEYLWKCNMGKTWNAFRKERK